MDREKKRLGIQNIFSGDILRPPEAPTDLEAEQLIRLKGGLCNSKLRNGKTLVPSGTFYLSSAWNDRLCSNRECTNETSRGFVLVSRHHCSHLYSSCSFKCDQEIVLLAKELDFKILKKARSFATSNRVNDRMPTSYSNPSPFQRKATATDVLLLLLRGKYCEWCGDSLDWSYDPQELTKGQHLFPQAPTIDHITPRSEGGSLGMENLCVCCYNCNQKRRPMLDQKSKSVL